MTWPAKPAIISTQAMPCARTHTTEVTTFFFVARATERILYLLLSLVREHRALNHVANRKDGRDLRLKVRIDDHAAELVGLDAHFLEAEAFGEGLAACERNGRERAR